MPDLHPQTDDSLMALMDRITKCSNRILSTHQDTSLKPT